VRGYTAKKGNRYYAVIYEGVDPATGKERRRWYPAGARKTDADKLVTELVKRHNDGEYRAPDKVTLGEYLTGRWLPAQRSQLKATTFHSYESNIRLHVLPTLGKVPLGRLTPEDLDALYGRLLESGRRNKSGDGPGLSPGSVRYVHRILRKALGDAVRKGTLNRNPASLADPPKRSTSAKREGEMRVWTSAQLQTFLASLDGERLAPAFVLAAHTGMRRGEVAGLRWADVDHGAPVRRHDETAALHGAAGVGIGHDEVAGTQHGDRTVEIPGVVDLKRLVRSLVVPQRETIGIGEGTEVLGGVGHA
jgi:integrase